ncbi:MAG: endonuclease III [Deltaproteobacteria bacterium]|nr:endonuclease III [Deltaproteobacteria bacterium]
MKARYRSPLLNNKPDPLDELVFIVLSQMTTSPSYERVFDRLKCAMPDWRVLTETSVSDLASLIADAGLSEQRAHRLKLIAARLAEDFGDVSLAQLGDYDDEIAQRYLTSLPGVGTKTAKCVMMYSLARQVLPVDTHTARVAWRLGLVSSGNHAAIDRELSVVVPPALRFDFHVNAVAHGRAVCRAVKPKCDECVLSSLCPIGRGVNGGTRTRRTSQS